MRRAHRPSRRAQAKKQAAAPFSPADIAGLEAWYRETYAAGTWADLSGNGRDLTQATADARPTQVARAGQAALSFDGGDLLSVTFGAPLLLPLTIYAIGEPAAGSLSVVRGWHAGTSNTEGQLATTATPAWRIFNGGLVSGGVVTEDVHGVCSVFNGASSALYVDDFVTAVASGNAGATTLAAFEVATDIIGGSRFSGHFWEFLIYSGAHDAATRKLIGDYLTARYTGLTVTT